MEGHAQIKQCITEKHSKKFNGITLATGKDSHSEFTFRERPGVFQLYYTKHPKFRDLQSRKFSFNYKMELRHHSTNDSEVILPQLYRNQDTVWKRQN